jgi:hypothetical protein
LCTETVKVEAKTGRTRGLVSEQYGIRSIGRSPVNSLLENEVLLFLFVKHLFGLLRDAKLPLEPGNGAFEERPLPLPLLSIVRNVLAETGSQR